LGRERPEDADSHYPGLDALLPQQVGGLRRLAGHGAHPDQIEFRVLGEIFPVQSPVVPAEDRGVVPVRRLDDGGRLLQCRLELVAHLHVTVAENAGAVFPPPGEQDGVEIPGIFGGEDGMSLVGRQEFPDPVGRRYGDGHHGVGQDEAVVADHDGAIDRFGDPVGLDYRIEDLLIVTAVDLDPAGVTLGEGVLLVVEDRPGRPDAAVYAAHDDGKPGAGGPVELLVHVEQAVGAGGGEHPGAHCGSGDAYGQGRMFPFDPDVFGLQFAALDVLGEDLRQLGLRGNGIGGDDLHGAEFGPDGRRGVTGHDLHVIHCLRPP